MDAYHFADHYQYVRRTELSFSDERLQRISDRLGRISPAYETLLDHVLRRDPAAPLQYNSANHQLGTWIKTSYTDDLSYIADRYVEDFGDPTIDISSRPVAALFNRVQFVPLTHSMDPEWRAAVKRIPTAEPVLSQIQTELAVRGLHYLDLIDSYERHGDLFVAQSLGDTGRVVHRLNPELSGVQGAMTELDAAITALDVSKAHPSVLFLPSPGKYEHGRDGSLNSDLIALDIDNDRAAGIQVKTQLSSDAYAQYNTDLMTFIDGRHDLGNVRAVRKPLVSTPTPIPWPGIVSLHHLMGQADPLRRQPGRQKGKGFRINTYDRHLMQTRLVGRRLIDRYPKSTRDSTTTALSRRIIRQLNHEPTLSEQRHF